MKMLPVLYTDDQAPLIAFYTAIGFETGFVSAGWTEFESTEGKFALHPRKPDSPTGYLEMGFACEKGEDLETIQARLAAAGFDQGRIQPEPFGRSLDVTDPEGRRLQINEAVDR
jgi:hypothetical protein